MKKKKKILISHAQSLLFRYFFALSLFPSPYISGYYHTQSYITIRWEWKFCQKSENWPILSFDQHLRSESSLLTGEDIKCIQSWFNNSNSTNIDGTFCSLSLPPSPPPSPTQKKPGDSSFKLRSCKITQATSIIKECCNEYLTEETVLVSPLNKDLSCVKIFCFHVRSRLSHSQWLHALYTSGLFALCLVDITLDNVGRIQKNVARSPQ